MRRHPAGMSLRLAGLALVAAVGLSSFAVSGVKDPPPSRQGHLPRS